jgi:hypothetical protein
VVNINVPRLENRKEDIPLLARHFVRHFALADSQVKDISPEALACLEAEFNPELGPSEKNICAFSQNLKIAIKTHPRNAGLVRKKGHSKCPGKKLGKPQIRGGPFGCGCRHHLPQDQKISDQSVTHQKIVK